MYCPLCGSSLDVVDRKEKPIEDPYWDDEKAVKAWQKACDKRFEKEMNEEQDDSIWYTCPNDCFGEGYELVHHYPLVGWAARTKNVDLLKTKPGDSWSLTWIK